MTEKAAEVPCIPNDWRETLAQRLKELREAKGYSQMEVSKKLGIAKATYANWEQARAVPSLEQAPILAHFFGVSADYLLGISSNHTSERLAARMRDLPESSQKIVMALVDEILSMK
ncbi:helix-turn-helix domain-containing protein [Selenomonas ruminantium]|uniref:Helix-turn-helix domain-containing protein n=1 Tax=Selenomonas ruminantium TaxID=971 RepID=A0A1H3XI88_SELRU|nr:helix-turn-helix transcriptional regulator [Selenomonas ruminantium]SDZ98332.1 Helix-turn-helix domain-containing protein [Selenomonas ruminantium]